MNVVLVLRDHPFHTELLVEWARHRPHDRVLLATLPRGRTPSAEPGPLCWRVLQWMVHRLGGVERAWPRPSRFAADHGIARVQRRGLDDPRLSQDLQRHRTDLLISVDLPLHPAALDHGARLGAINAHLAAQPGFQGQAPWIWELARGEGRLSISLHRPRVDRGLGPQLAEAWYEPDPGTSPFVHHYQAVQVAARLLPVLAEELERGTVSEDARDDSEVSALPRPDAAAFRGLRERGFPRWSWRQAFALLAGRYDGFVAHHERFHAA